jgi:hypothetical protein
LTTGGTRFQFGGEPSSQSGNVGTFGFNFGTTSNTPQTSTGISFGPSDTQTGGFELRGTTGFSSAPQTSGFSAFGAPVATTSQFNVFGAPVTHSIGFGTGTTESTSSSFTFGSQTDNSGSFGGFNLRTTSRDPPSSFSPSRAPQQTGGFSFGGVSSSSSQRNNNPDSYHPTEEFYANQKLVYHSISKMPRYANYSFEEISWNNIERSVTTESGFGSTGFRPVMNDFTGSSFGSSTETIGAAFNVNTNRSSGTGGFGFGFDNQGLAGNTGGFSTNRSTGTGGFSFDNQGLTGNTGGFSSTSTGFGTVSFSTPHTSNGVTHDGFAFGGEPRLQSGTTGFGFGGTPSTAPYSRNAFDFNDIVHEQPQRSFDEYKL